MTIKMIKIGLDINGTVNADDVSIPTETLVELYFMARTFRGMLALVEQREGIVYEGGIKEEMDDTLRQAEDALRSVGLTVSEGKER